MLTHPCAGGSHAHSPPYSQIHRTLVDDFPQLRRANGFSVCGDVKSRKNTPLLRFSCLTREAHKGACHAVYAFVRVTGYAPYCDRRRPLGSICTTIINAEGDYLVIVKEHQATTLRAITTLFASRAD